MHVRPWLAAVLTLLLMAPSLRSQEGLQFFPIDQVEPGLKGVGLTVFEGNKIEEFQVEILGVLKNALAPKHDIILARLSGGPLEKTGVIAGMSGSPVYIDGKLVGAVALSFPLAKEPIAGITPIAEMLGVVPGPALPQLRVAQGTTLRIAGIPGSAGEVRLISEPSDEPPDWGRWLPAAGGDDFASLRLPLQFGGFSSDVIQAHTPIFRRMGFEPMQGGAISAGQGKSLEKIDLAPGSMISLLLVRGKSVV